MCCDVTKSNTLSYSSLATPIDRTVIKSVSVQRLLKRCGSQSEKTLFKYIWHRNCLFNSKGLRVMIQKWTICFAVNGESFFLVHKIKWWIPSLRVGTEGHGLAVEGVLTPPEETEDDFQEKSRIREDIRMIQNRGCQSGGSPWKTNPSSNSHYKIPFLLGTFH